MKETDTAIDQIRKDVDAIRLGEWVGLKLDTVYHADTDGFVAAFSGGSNPPKLTNIESGSSADMAMRSRFGQYLAQWCRYRKVNIG